MKLIYLSTKDFSNGNGDGVVKKILNHIKCFEKSGFDVDYTYTDSRDNTVHFVQGGRDIVIGRYKILSGVFCKTIIYKYLKNHLSELKYDCTYIRFLGGRTDPWHLDILRVLKKHNVRIVLEITTYPYDDEGSKFETFIDRMFRWRLKKYVDIITTFSVDDEIFGIKTIVTKNGVDVDSIKKIDSSNSDAKQINLIAVSSFINYHGYERLLNGLGEYYKNHGDGKKVMLHMVGDGTEMEYYKQIVSDYSIEDKVIFYGFKSGSELDTIYDKADVAIGSLGIYKIGLNTVSSIKTKEYISRGLPVAAGFYEIGLFDENTDFFLNVGNDASYIDIPTVIDWYDKIIKKYGDKEKLVNTIRQYAYDNVDMSIVLKPVIDYLKK